jgi:hypothetical protein
MLMIVWKEFRIEESECRKQKDKTVEQKRTTIL